jgi:general stress protein YciG
MDIQNDPPAFADLLENERPPAEKPKKKRGFAAMNPEKVREIAHRGGIAVHAKGTAHKFTPEQAVEAGRKGGYAAHAARSKARAEGAKDAAEGEKS